jgi:hypothetical protein
VDDFSVWWRYLSARQLWGYVSALAGVVFTLLTAVVTGPNQLLVAVIAVVAQGFAAFVFSSHGRAHPTLVQSAFNRLVALGQRVKTAENTAQASFESQELNADQLQTRMGIVSAELSWIGDGIYDAAADWIAFNEPLLELIDEKQRKEIMRAAKEAQKAAETGNDVTKIHDAAHQ